MRRGVKIVCSGAPKFFLFCLLAKSLFSATIYYQEDSTTNFTNPERGIRSDVSRGATLRRIYFELGNYKNVDQLPQSVFDEVTNECKSAREEGMKIIARFRYYRETGSDAPLARILKHIEQLGPVLKANSDIIALYEAGFIGCWGEWHHFNSVDINNLDNTAARKAILFKELGSWPQDRMIVIRYNTFKRDIFGINEPLGPDSAFCGSFRARTGHQNDCFRYNADDRGTYYHAPYKETIEFQKAYLNQDCRYVAQVGEACGTSPLSECDSAMHDLKRMHWDCLASTTYITQWTRGGCINKILMRYGYRLALRSALLPDSARPGDFVMGTINLQNVGWGKIFNPRGCELVFRNMSTRAKFIVKLENDPRRWCMTDSVVSVPLSAPLPMTMPEGSYQMYLNLPDPYPSLHDRKEYSIRLANNNVWEESTGYNSLLHTVHISSKAPISGVVNRTTAPEGLEKYKVKSHNGSIEFTVPGTTSAPITLEVFSVKGERIWTQTVNWVEGGKRSVKWPAYSSGIYLWRISRNDKKPVLVASGVIRSLTGNDW